jgi:hypothetical protein
LRSSGGLPFAKKYSAHIDNPGALRFKAGKFENPLRRFRTRRKVVDTPPSQSISGFGSRHFGKNLRTVTEPGGAPAFAALLSGVYKPSSGERVGVILSGGNITVLHFS